MRRNLLKVHSRSSACSGEETRLRLRNSAEVTQLAGDKQGCPSQPKPVDTMNPFRSMDNTYVPHHLLGMVGARLIFHSLMSLLNFKIKLYEITCKIL